MTFWMRYSFVFVALTVVSLVYGGAWFAADFACHLRWQNQEARFVPFLGCLLRDENSWAYERDYQAKQKPVAQPASFW